MFSESFLSAAVVRVRMESIEPLQTMCLACDVSAQQRADWEALGLDLLSKGKLAVLLLAGGQGTRLGLNKPKGLFQIGEPINKTLYELQAERLQAMCKKVSFSIALYVMCSDATFADTVAYFEANDNFGMLSMLMHRT